MAKRPNKVIGVDIGSSSIKMVEMKKSGNRYTIENAISFPCVGVWKDGLPVEADVAGITFEKAVAAFGSPSKQVAMAIPTASSMVRVVPMESSLKGDDLWSTIEANISQYFPFSAEEVYMDFKINGPSSGIERHNDILVVAAQKEFVNERELTADIAGIKLKSVDIDIYALLNLIKLTEPLDSYSNYDGLGIIDIGLYRTGFHVVLGSGSVYVRELPVGGERLTEIVSDKLNISMEEAESLKLRGDWSSNPLMQESFSEFCEELGAQVSSAIDVYLPNNPQVVLKNLFVTGGLATISGLAEIIAKEVERSVQILDPAQFFELSNKVIPRLNGASIASLSVACGLAMKDFL